MQPTHWMVRLARIAAMLFVLLGCLMIFIYTPFYSQMMVKLLNHFVPVEVNEVAAESQKQAALSEHESLEPGSRLWIARQAYLKVMEHAIQTENSQELVTIHLRYKALQTQIQKEKAAEEDERNQPKIQVPLLVASEPQLASAAQVIDPVGELLNLNSAENKVLMDRYVKFLNHYQVNTEALKSIDDEIYQDIAYIQDQNQDQNSVSVESKAFSKAYAIVVLGGGLTLDKNKKEIVVNNYTRLRLEKTLEVEKKYKLPIVLSGVEAPYMQKWLKNYGVDAKLLEDRSMNTCENSRFSSLLLQKKGGAPSVILITDRYHMPRTRRLFALNGIETLPIEAPMPTTLTNWEPKEQNYDHSRRANYEMLATLRDVLFGSSGCREVP